MENDEDDYLSWCIEYLSEGYVSITEDVSIVEPDIDNGTSVSEAVWVRATLDFLLVVYINLIPTEGNKEVWYHFELE